MPLTKILSVTPLTKSRCGGCSFSELSIASNDILNAFHWEISTITRCPLYCRLWDHLHSHGFTVKTKVLFMFKITWSSITLCKGKKNLILSRKENGGLSAAAWVWADPGSTLILFPLLQCYSVSIPPSGGKYNITLVEEHSLLFYWHLAPTTQWGQLRSEEEKEVIIRGRHKGTTRMCCCA